MLLIFDTHPIQYRAPVFSSLHAKHPDMKVYFFNAHFQANKWWFHETGAHPKQPFGIPMTEGYPSQVLSTESLPLWRRYGLFKKLLKKDRPSAVLIFGYFLPEHWLLRLLCEKLRIPLLFIGETFQTNGKSLVKKSLKQPLLRYFFSGVDQFIAIGEKTAKFYEGWHIPESRIQSAKYCVDTTFFSLPENRGLETRQKLRAEWGIPQDAFVVLFVGRLFSRKRPQDLVEVHRRFTTHPGYYTVAIGNGPLEKAFQTASESLPRFLYLGFKNQKEIRDVYHAADILFVPSEYETWGLVVNEAFAAGLPALVTNTCGVSNDLVIDNETGFSFPVGDLDTATQILGKLSVDRETLARLKQKARAKVTSEYRVDQFAENILTAFERSQEI